MKKRPLIKVGDRVRVRSVDLKGKVTFIDVPRIHANHMYPYQIELDEPNPDPNFHGGHHWIRTHRDDLRKLVRRKKQ